MNRWTTRDMLRELRLRGLCSSLADVQLHTGLSRSTVRSVLANDELDRGFTTQVLDKISGYFETPEGRQEAEQARALLATERWWESAGGDVVTRATLAGILILQANGELARNRNFWA